MLTPSHSWFFPLEGHESSVYMYTHLDECKLWFEHKEIVNNDDICHTLVLHLLDLLRTRGIGLSLVHHRSLYLTNRIIAIRSDARLILEILVDENAHILIDDVFNPSPDSLQGNRAGILDQLRPIAPNCCSAENILVKMLEYCRTEGRHIEASMLLEFICGRSSPCLH